MIRRIRVLALAGLVLALVAAALPAAAAEFVIFEPGDGRVSPPVPLNSAPPRPVLTPPESLPADLTDGAYLVVNTDNLYMRQGASPEYAPVAIVDGGTSLIPLGWNGVTNDVWWYVQVGGMRGWVRGEFVYLRGDARGLPIIDSQGTLTLPRLYVGWENFLRSAPTYDDNYICLFPGNLEYEIVGRTSDSTWYELSVRCDTGRVVEGWLPAENGILRNPAGVYIPVTWF